MPTPSKSAAKFPYRSITGELTERVLALIEDNPCIIKMHDPSDLFGLPGFYCADLSPSMLQMETALDIAKRQWTETHP